MPSAMPMTPPIVVSSTASSRNCTPMSRGRAPTALRRPISLVRSRTETSMMLETPTPPTSRRDAGDRGQHAGEDAEDVAEHAEDLLLGDRAELGVRVAAGPARRRSALPSSSMLLRGRAP